MIFFMLRRLAALIITLLVASLLIFLLLEILPGDPAAVILGVGAQDDTLQALRTELGLNLPAPVRYLNWLSEVLQGNLGRS
ncbi:MAG: ABC transporter permease, partial [SAR324 cluster bacterium]|nr:ABC transporter permease [SAR324 cluster bacterium]